MHDPEVIGECPHSACGLAGAFSSSLTASRRRYDVAPILMRLQGLQRSLGLPSSASSVGDGSVFVVRSCDPFGG
jgi:hypothetical protein